MNKMERNSISDIFDNVMKLANSENNFKDGDYYDEEGLLRCGKCHTKKQTRLNHPFTGKEQVVVCVCECERERRDKEREAEEAYWRAKRLKADGVQDKNLLNWTFENADKDSPDLKKAKTYVEKWQEMYKDNIGLLLTGDVGTGKTYFAACIANALLDRSIPVLMTNFSKLVAELSKYDTDKNAFLNSLNHYKLMIIDDLGVERQSEFVMEQVYNIIDSRYKNGQPMIITTNIPITEIQNPKDMNYKRIYDRILENCIPMLMTGQSRRKEAGKNKLERARELFK